MDLGRIRRQCCGYTGEITVTRRSASRYKLPLLSRSRGATKSYSRLSMR